jgi:hypothetical protein
MKVAIKTGMTGGLAAAAAAAACLLAAPAIANANVEWLVTGTLSGGGTVTGTFTTDIYGFITGPFDLEATASSPLVAESYTNGGTDYISSGANFVDFQPGYVDDLHIQFQNSLLSGSANNPIVVGSSYECQGSSSCFVPSGGETQLFTSGFAEAIPEPAAWAMLILGFFGLGALLRTARGRSLPAGLVLS